jgi:hypothetical protein
MFIVRTAARAIAVIASLVATLVQAHPAPQGALRASVGPASVRMVATISLEEVSIGSLHLAGSNSSERARLELYAGYLSRHIRIVADGKSLVARPLRVPARLREPLEFELDFAFAGSPPRELRISQDALREFFATPGNRWEARYLLTVEPGSRAPVLLTFERAVTVRCDWQPEAGCGLDSDAPNLYGALTLDGIRHILTGYDHLLFVAALLLAATTLLDLAKVIGAFTLAHTLTLALATFGVLRVEPALIEPVIAASIVAVAAQNLFWPRQSRGGARLATAFAFGLFHGLGFAGGLADAMAATAIPDLLWGLVSFSVGVEVGHMLVVLPLYAALVCARRARHSAVNEPLALRVGSALIGVAGLYFLALAPGVATP